MGKQKLLKILKIIFIECDGKTLSQKWFSMKTVDIT